MADSCVIDINQCPAKTKPHKKSESLFGSGQALSPADGSWLDARLRRWTSLGREHPSPRQRPQLRTQRPAGPSVENDTPLEPVGSAHPPLDRQQQLGRPLDFIHGQRTRNQQGIRIRARLTQDVQVVPAKPERYNWIARAGCVFFRKSFVARSLRAFNRPAPRSRLVLRKNPQHHPIPANCIVPAKNRIQTRES
jgi:hypothetical protein